MTTHTDLTPRRFPRRRLIQASGLAAGALAVAGVTPLAVTAAKPGAALSGEIHAYLGDYPSERETGWAENIQGVTHDEANWYFTQTMTIWKFPVSHNLNTRVAGPDPARGILRAGLPAALKAEGYNHFGDFDCVRYVQPYAGVHRFLFIPIEGGAVPGIAVFRGDDLSYIGRWLLPNEMNAPLCAYNPGDGLLYIGSSLQIDGRPVLRHLKAFRVDFWQLLAGKVVMQHVKSASIVDEAGKLLTLPYGQGACFTPDGGRMYLVNGYYTDTDRNTAGIHVLDTRAFQRIAKSTNGYGAFNYEFHPGWSRYEEPEGITYWDLNDGRAPGIRGVLHALLLDNDLTEADDLYLKHYA
jgi:hypothetical protein